MRASCLRPAFSAALRIAPPQSSLALPVAGTLREASIVAAASGVLGVTAQLSFVFVLNRLLCNGKPNRWKTGYMAHHMVCVLFMLVASTIGVLGWLSPAGATASVRLGVTHGSAAVRFLSAVLLGMLLLWDLPCSVIIPKLRNPVMFGHHLAMAVTTFLAVIHLPMHYGFFYLGVSEVSSIPLCVNGLASYAYDTLSEEAEPPEATLKALAAIRESCELLFAALFLWLRGYMFTRVTLGPYLADMMALLSPAAAATSAASAAAAVSSKLVPLRMMLGLGLSFNVLQLCWAVVIVRTALGMAKKA